MPDNAVKVKSTHCLEIAAATDLLYPGADLYPDARSRSKYRWSPPDWVLPPVMQYHSPQISIALAPSRAQHPKECQIASGFNCTQQSICTWFVFTLVITPCSVIGVPVRAANDMRQHRLEFTDTPERLAPLMRVHVKAKTLLARACGQRVRCRRLHTD